MGNVATILNRIIFLFFAVALILSSRAIASDELGQYGLGAEGLSVYKDKWSSKKAVAKDDSFKSQPSEQLSYYQFALDFENDYRQYATKQAGLHNNQIDLNTSSFQIDFEYQDRSADISSPFHSVNSDLTNKLNSTSNEYQTRMGYQLKHLTPEASINYSPDSYGFGEYYNYELGVAVPVKNIFSLETRYGWNRFDKHAKHGGIDDYQDWSVGVSTIYKGMKLKVDYVDMNSSEKTHECGQLFPCEGKTVFSIIKNF